MRMTGAPMRRISKYFLLPLVAATAVAMTAPAAATTMLTGVVLSAGTPVGNAQVTASGDNVSQRTRTNPAGRFSFANLGPGSYLVSANGDGGEASTTLDLPASGADITLKLSAKKLGIISVTVPPPVRKSGTDVTLNREALSRSPAAGSFPELLIQLPGAARGAHGVVHITGDHGE